LSLAARRTSCAPRGAGYPPGDLGGSRDIAPIINEFEEADLPLRRSGG
jgi:hypothetical protein